jgi:hypothetical protein
LKAKQGSKLADCILNGIAMLLLLLLLLLLPT